MKNELGQIKKLTLPILISTLLMGGCSTLSETKSSEAARIQEQNQMINDRDGKIASLESNLYTERKARYQLESNQVAVNNGAPVTAPKLLPPDAKVGECYARVFLPPQYKTENLTILNKEASERFDIIPAQYEMVNERVMVKEASERLEIVPAQYEWVEEQVLVEPASERIVEVPAIYRTDTEQVLDKPEHTAWKKGTGPITKIDAATGEIMCLVTVPATYKTVTKRVLVSKATTRSTDITAKYKTIKKRILKTAATTRSIEIPAEYKTVKTRKLVESAKTTRIPVKAEYEMVTKRSKISDGKVEWRPVLCKTNMNAQVGGELQTALKNAGFNPGPIDGIIGRQTMAATTAYQRDKGLPTGGLTMETLKSLDVSLSGN